MIWLKIITVTSINHFNLKMIKEKLMKMKICFYSIFRFINFKLTLQNNVSSKILSVMQAFFLEHMSPAMLNSLSTDALDVNAV